MRIRALPIHYYLETQEVSEFYIPAWSDSVPLSVMLLSHLIHLQFDRGHELSPGHPFHLRANVSGDVSSILEETSATGSCAFALGKFSLGKVAS